MVANTPRASKAHVAAVTPQKSYMCQKHIRILFTVRQLLINHDMMLILVVEAMMDLE